MLEKLLRAGSENVTSLKGNVFFRGDILQFFTLLEGKGRRKGGEKSTYPTGKRTQNLISSMKIST